MQLGPLEGGRVDRDLVRARVEDRLGVGDRAHAASDREGHEHLVGGAARQAGDRVALLVRCRDVEEHELVGALAVVVRRELHGVAGVADVDEFHALDHATGVDVEAGDDALVVHRPTVACGLPEPRSAQQEELASPARSLDGYSPASACWACAIVKRRS